MTLTSTTITSEQIEALRTEAAQAGDNRLVETCDVALDHASRGIDPSPAIETCVDVINAARAQDDSETERE